MYESIFSGITPRLSYDGLCEGLARRGFLVIATPLAADSMRIGSIWNHHRLARAAAEDFREAWDTVEERSVSQSGRQACRQAVRGHTKTHHSLTTQFTNEPLDPSLPMRA